MLAQRRGMALAHHAETDDAATHAFGAGSVCSAAYYARGSRLWTQDFGLRTLHSPSRTGPVVTRPKPIVPLDFPENGGDFLDVPSCPEEGILIHDYRLVRGLVRNRSRHDADIIRVLDCQFHIGRLQADGARVSARAREALRLNRGYKIVNLQPAAFCWPVAHSGHVDAVPDHAWAD